MRLLEILHDEREAMAFSLFLQEKRIVHQLEIQTNKDWESPNYGSHECYIWIYEEDQFQEALKWLNLFKENPQDPSFQSIKNISLIPVQPEEQPSISPLIHDDKFSTPSSQQTATTHAWHKQPMEWLTRLLLLSCCFLFISMQFWVPNTQVPARYTNLMLFTSPIEKTLLYDYPKFYELVSRFIQSYGYEGLENPEELSREGKHLLKKINQTPFWPGIYHLLLKDGLNGMIKGFKEYPTFEKIREGQIWRLFSPCLLHGDLFHLFFNMIWLIVLGKQMEQRLRQWRYGFFILIIGVLSNTAQYLTSGSNFIGFSGVLCGMLAFIWARQKYAAWEGYQLDRLTLIFILIFIMGMALIQLFSFLLEKNFDVALSLNIANVAHLTGGLVGYILGRLNFFSWRHT